MRENLKKKLQHIDNLLYDPFNPYALEEAFQSLLSDLRDLSKEEAQEVYTWLDHVYQRLEENHKIALGWLEYIAKWEEQGDIKA